MENSLDHLVWTAVLWGLYMIFCLYHEIAPEKRRSCRYPAWMAAGTLLFTGGGFFWLLGH
jgi:hypothetical protein